jgi:glycerate kinase
MKIVIAPDSFKECLTAQQVAAAIEAGFRDVLPDAEYVVLPMADGGEGTVAALVAATGGRCVSLAVTGPLGESVVAEYGLTGDGKTAVVEMAAASGLGLVPPDRRNPLLTTSYGTGELIRAALATGVDRLIVGIGGSATNDGGAGMLQALGVKLLDRCGGEIGAGGGSLADLDRIDLTGIDPRLAGCCVEVACDVTNPLIGPNGASAVYGPQKGATPAMVAVLESHLTHFARLIARDLGIDVATMAGAGAAGGMGAALLAFLHARLRPGIDIVMEAANLEAVVRDADLVVTGEGCIDRQTLRGKTPLGVARVAKRHHKPVIAIAGSIADDGAEVQQQGIDAMFSVLSRVGTLDDALAHAAANIRTTARNIAACCKVAGLARQASPGLPAAGAAKKVPTTAKT